MLRKQKTRAWLLSLAALVLLLSNYFVGWAEEPDPRILWVNKELYKIGGFVVHPNGNVIAYGLASIYDKATGIFEIDGKDGKLIKVLPNTQHISNFEQMDISYDGRYIVTPGVNLYDLQKNTLEKLEINSGNFVTFLPNQHKIANVSGGTVGNNSSIIIYDIDTKNKVNIKTEEAIRNIAFSPDGKYFATAGVKENLGGKFNTTLKLWDAQTLKLIKELERFDDKHYSIWKIQFSQDNMNVAFHYTRELAIYNTSTFDKFKVFNQQFLNDVNDNTSVISTFAFLTNDNIILTSKKTVLANILDNLVKKIIDFPTYSHTININKSKDVLFVSTKHNSVYGPLVAVDLKVALSNDAETPLNTEMKTEYQNGNLLISGINSSNNSVNIDIFDISGKLIRQLNAVPNGTEIRFPIVLPLGTYLINLTDGSKKYSSKFIVTE